MNTKDTTPEEELRKIEELHERDKEASRTGDFETLRSLFTDDAVLMAPGGPLLRGADQLREQFEQMAEAYRGVDILEYEIEFKEVKILSDYAYEWGTISGSSKTKDNEIEYSSYNLMRILKKDADGEWKVHRTIWNHNFSDSAPFADG